MSDTWRESIRSELAQSRVDSVDRLTTPLLSIDANIMFDNLQRMADYTAEHKLSLRPHIKTHKSSFLAEQQIRMGAVGLTSAKPSEAQAVATSARDLLLAYPCFTEQRLSLLASLALERTVRVAVDSEEAIQRIASGAQRHGSQFGLLIDLDVGHHRTGVQSPEQLVSLAKLIDSSNNVSFDGVLYFPGHVVPSACDMDAGQRKVGQIINDAIDALAQAGLACGIVSGGSTPTATMSHQIPELTEIRPGTYIFNDVNSVHWQCATWQQCAAAVHATVISTAVPGKAVIDAGSKMLSSDRCGAAPEIGFGWLVDHPGARLARLSEEHGEIELEESDWSPAVGERVRIIPNHVCPVVNLQNDIFLQIGDGEAYRLSVDGRGCVR